MTVESAYRNSHTSPGYGKRYDDNYSVGYYAALYREIESPMLHELFAELGGKKSLLDFACGTGRITRLAVPHFETVVGVDVSEAMLQNARESVSATFLLQDITKQPLDRRFAVATAFRFFLNAEEELRRQALSAIRHHLVADGYLVCNIHMNKWSIMGFVYGAARRIPGVTTHATLSLGEFRRTLQDCGFLVERVVWYGVVPRPGRRFARFLDRWLGPLERWIAKMGLCGRFAHSFLVVARPAKTTDGHG